MSAMLVSWSRRGDTPSRRAKVSRPSGACVDVFPDVHSAVARDVLPGAHIGFADLDRTDSAAHARDELRGESIIDRPTNSATAAIATEAAAASQTR